MDDPTPDVNAPSTPPQRFRRTRIAVSVFFGVMTVALCVLWLRSYWALDGLYTPFPFHKGMDAQYGIDAHSGLGVLAIRFESLAPGEYAVWSATSRPCKADAGDDWGWDDARFQCQLDTDPEYGLQLVVGAPFWLWAIVFLAAGIVAFRLPVHFSLRTMLIATTLVAVALGLDVWLAR